MTWIATNRVHLFSLLVITTVSLAPAQPRPNATSYFFVLLNHPTNALQLSKDAGELQAADFASYEYLKAFRLGEDEPIHKYRKSIQALSRISAWGWKIFEAKSNNDMPASRRPKTDFRYFSLTD
jgi:hypothetical protein